MIDWLIDWCLTPTLTVFQLYDGVNFYMLTWDTHMTRINKTYFSIKQIYDSILFRKHMNILLSL